MNRAPAKPDTGHRTPDTGHGGQWQPQADTGGVSAREPLEAAYRVTPAEIEQAISRTSAQYMGDLRTMLAEVGRVYEGQLAAKDAALAAKDEALTTKDQAISTQAETIAELRRRAEQAEAERDRLAAAQTAPYPPGSTEEVSATNLSPAPVVGFWARVRRVFVGGEG